MKFRILIRVELGFSSFIKSLILIWFIIVPIITYIKPPIAFGRGMPHTEETKGEKSWFLKGGVKSWRRDRKFEVHPLSNLALWECDRRSRGDRDVFPVHS